MAEHMEEFKTSLPLLRRLPRDLQIKILRDLPTSSSRTLRQVVDTEGKIIEDIESECDDLTQHMAKCRDIAQGNSSHLQCLPYFL